MRDLPRGEDLTGASLAAEPGGQVQRSTPVAALDRDGLAGVQPDSDREGQLRVVQRLLHEPSLEVDRGADRVPGRGEHAQRLVPAELEQCATADLDSVAREVGKPGRELGRSLVASLLREPRVSANVGDQEGAYLGIPRTVITQGCVWANVDHPRIIRPRISTVSQEVGALSSTSDRVRPLLRAGPSSSPAPC